MTALPQATALLLIDLQRAVADPERGRRSNPEAEGAIARLLAAWRASGRPVVHVQHLSTEAPSPCRAGRPGCHLEPDIVPRAGEIVAQKSGDSAFVETGLAALLRDQGIADLVIAGAGIDHGVEATARMAGNLGFATIVVSDATWTVDGDDLDGRLRRAQETNALSLARSDDVLTRLGSRAAPSSPVPAELVAGRPSP